MPYTIRYYRDEESSHRYSWFGKLDKPPGWRTGKSRYERQIQAQAEADYINRMWRPEHPVQVVSVP